MKCSKRYHPNALLTLPALVVLACLFCLLHDIPAQDHVKNAPVDITILSFNIRHGEGMDGQVDLGRATQLIRSLSPDIVAIQEVDSGVERTGGVDQPRFLAEKTGMQALFGKFMDYQGGEYGMALLSRFPIESHHNLPLPPGSEPRTALNATLRLNSRLKLTVAGIHLYRTEAQRICQAHRLVDAFAALPEPVILVGDFNSEPGSPVLSLLERFWHNPGKEGNPLTYPSDEPKKEIDFVLFRPVEMFQVLESRVVDDSLTSDHRPVLLRVRLLR